MKNALSVEARRWTCSFVCVSFAEKQQPACHTTPKCSLRIHRLTNSS